MSADDVSIEIKQGRHPVIQHLIGEGGQYVPNDTLLQVSATYTVKVKCGGGLQVFQMMHTGFFHVLIVQNLDIQLDMYFILFVKKYCYGFFKGISSFIF